MTILDALVGAALAGIALAGLAGTAALSSQSLRLVRDSGSALALANERLETLRAGPRVDGSDRWTGPDGTVFTRSWTHGAGRGRPATLSTQVTWRRRTLSLGTEALP